MVAGIRPAANVAYVARATGGCRTRPSPAARRLIPTATTCRQAHPTHPYAGDRECRRTSGRRMPAARDTPARPRHSPHSQTLWLFHTSGAPPLAHERGPYTTRHLTLASTTR